MEEIDVRRFELFVRHVPGFACHIVDEAEAEVAIIDVDHDLGAYMVQAHRMLFPGRPVMQLSSAGKFMRDKHAVCIEKPVTIEKFVSALEQSLRESDAAGRQADVGEPAPGHRATAISQDSAELRKAQFYVGSMPDLDPSDVAIRERAYYQPGIYLQGMFESARRFARANEAMTVLVHRGAPILKVGADGRSYASALDSRSLRSLAMIPLAKDDVRIIAGSVVKGEAWRAATPLVWDLALWAARGRIPGGTALDATIRLLRWPNLTRLALPPDAVRIAGLWSCRPSSLIDTANVLAIPQRNVFAFFSACQALGLLECAAPSPKPQTRSRESVTADAEPQRRGLFKRILGKLFGMAHGDAEPEHE